MQDCVRLKSKSCLTLFHVATCVFILACVVVQSSSTVLAPYTHTPSWSSFVPFVHTHTPLCTLAHSAHTHAHTHAHTCTHACTHKHKHTCHAYTHTHTHTHTRIHSMHAHTHTHKNMKCTCARLCTTIHLWHPPHHQCHSSPAKQWLA